MDVKEFIGHRCAYRLGEADFRLAQRLANQQCISMAGGTSVVFWTNVAAWTLISMGVLQLLKVADREVSGQRVWLAIALVLVGAFVSWLSDIWRRRRIWARVLAVVGPFPTEHTLLVQEEGLAFEDSIGQLLVRWSAILAVQQLPGHVAIVVRPYLVLVVPRSAFDSTEASERFAACLSERISATAPRRDQRAPSLG